MSDIGGAIFFSCMCTFMAPMMMTVNVFQLERPVFLREQANKLYSFLPYYISKNAIEVPVALLAPLIQELILYWSSDFRRGTSEFFKIYLVLILINQVATGTGLFISCLANSVPTATSIAPLFNLPVILFGGLFANSSTLPSYISWMQWISPVFYANQAMNMVQFSGVNFMTDYFLTILGFDLSYTTCVWILFGFMIFWRISSIILLRLMITKF